MLRRPRMAVLIAGCVLAGSGCSSLPPPPGPDPVTASPAPVTTTGRSVPPPVENDLQKLLLTAADLPGFKALPDSGNDRSSPDDQFTGCPALTASPDAGPSVSVNVQFTGGFVGPLIGETITSSDVAQAQSSVDGFAALAKQCRRFTSKTDDGTAITYVVAVLDVPTMGDQVAGVQMTGTVPGFPAVHAEAVVVRRGGVVIQISHGAAKQPDTALTLSTARRALERVELGR